MSVERSVSMYKSCMWHSGVVKEMEQNVEKPNWGEKTNLERVLVSAAIG